jgi:type VI secretion system protein ImpG
VYEVEGSPVTLAEVRFDPVVKIPATIKVPPGITSAISISITLETARRRKQPHVRFYIDGEPSFCAALRDALFMRCASVVAELGDGQVRQLERTPLAPVGFADEDALVPFTARSHAASRILLEYFAFPEKFNWFDLLLDPGWTGPGEEKKLCKFHFLLRNVHHDSDSARLLGTITNKNLLIGCTPVVNLFKRPGEPISITHTATDYPVTAHPNFPHNFEIYSVDTAHMQKQAGMNAKVTEFRPLYALRHAEDAEGSGHYWVLRHDTSMAASRPGLEKRISFVDPSFNPAQIEKITVSLGLTCTNRDLPARLKLGGAEGDLQLLTGTNRAPIRFVRRPSPTFRFKVDAGLHWQFISHLTLNHRSLTTNGIAGFHEMLLLHDVTQSSAARRQITGIVGFEQRDTATWIKSKFGVSLVHGSEILITINEDAFIGRSIHLLAQVLDHFLAMYAQLNSFIEVVILSQQSGEEILRCKPRTGKKPLL